MGLRRSVDRAPPGQARGPGLATCQVQTYSRTVADTDDDRLGALVSRLRAAGAITTPGVECAFRVVPRHLFLSAGKRAWAYEDSAILIKDDPRGTPISALSHPVIIAMMLEALDVVEGQNVLEVGTGSGYNTALLAELVGPTGAVLSMELETDLADLARQRLAEFGYRHVDVVVGDGAYGAESRSPYDRIVVTAGAKEVTGAWSAQLAPHGRLVVPLVDAFGAGVIMACTKKRDGLDRREIVPCRFLPMRTGTSS
jgi:protein-L-isoaspartate(D-aspartate) O-methyltransferase